MEISIGVLLHEHSPSGSEGSVRHDEEEFGSVWHLMQLAIDEDCRVQKPDEGLEM